MTESDRATLNKAQSMPVLMRLRNLIAELKQATPDRRAAIATHINDVLD
jgi:hypothetical protein